MSVDMLLPAMCTQCIHESQRVHVPSTACVFSVLPSQEAYVYITLYISQTFDISVVSVRLTHCCNNQLRFASACALVNFAFHLRAITSAAVSIIL